jgi:hypothetical protein
MGLDLSEADEYDAISIDVSLSKKTGLVVDDRKWHIQVVLKIAAAKSRHPQQEIPLHN